MIYQKDKLEILVIDGMREDGIRKIVKEYTKKYSFMKFLDNSRKIVPTALNIGIKETKSKVVIRMDAHNVYISKCIKYLKKYNVDNVGGILVTLLKGYNISEVYCICSFSSISIG